MTGEEMVAFLDAIWVHDQVLTVAGGLATIRRDDLGWHVDVAGQVVSERTLRAVLEHLAQAEVEP